MKVKKVYYGLPPKTIPYIRGDHAKFSSHYGSDLMSMDHATTDRIWILDEPWKCLLELDVGWMEFSAKRGWWLDWASIPGIAESVEKRDDRSGLIAATIHDMMFALQFPFFDTANEIFYQVMRIGGTSLIRAKYKYWSVNSCFGWDAWCESSDPKKQAIEEKWVSVKMVPTPSAEFQLFLENERHGN